jgi:hypothetical protein
LRRIFDEHERALTTAMVESELTPAETARVLRLAFCQYTADTGIREFGARVLVAAQKLDERNALRARVLKRSKPRQPSKRGA